MHHPTNRIAHTTAFVTPVVEHWLEREIAQWVHPTKDRSDDPSQHERTLLPRSYISLLICIEFLYSVYIWSTRNIHTRTPLEDHVQLRLYTYLNITYQIKQSLNELVDSSECKMATAVDKLSAVLAQPDTPYIHPGTSSKNWFGSNIISTTLNKIWLNTLIPLHVKWPVAGKFSNALVLQDPSLNPITDED